MSSVSQQLAKLQKDEFGKTGPEEHDQVWKGHPD